jgi:cobalamin biosynthetic protein CobC
MTASPSSSPRDHGGGIDAAVSKWGGTRADWLDLSTGINPAAYAISTFTPDAWTALPDKAAQTALLTAARGFWNIPEEAAILAAPGASSLIARIPTLWPQATARIQTPTYNEHAGAFEAHGWQVTQKDPAPVRAPAQAAVQVVVHPNNPDGRLWQSSDFTAPFTVIDESFCDVMPELSHIDRAARGDTLILKSFGKFWGLAGLRLGFAIGAPALINRLSALIGPWAVSGPALETGAAALSDTEWASQTRIQLQNDSDRMDALLTKRGAKCLGGTTLFRLYEVDDAIAWQDRLAKGYVWSRTFPYSKTWLRLGLPAADCWEQLECALNCESAP